MPAPSPSGPDAAFPEVAETERLLTRITCLGTRARHHDRLRALTGVPLDRAAAALLRRIADREPLRPGEVAHYLGAEVSPVTRTVRRLRRAGCVTRAPGPDDGRAQRSGSPARAVDDFLAYSARTGTGTRAGPAAK
ncbi:MarR family transcriptional regulator [Streptomyces sp. NPDC091383]|uniref:MarR family transcriptional regulator n=1 Tax=Streptomyces sp. NPDC091383 TaxID=3365996 RepID=UPI00380C31C5